MDFLDGVRGPLLWISIAVFVAGGAWRLLWLWRMPRGPAPGGRARRPFGPGAAMDLALARFLPPGGFRSSATLATFNPYVFHIGLALVFFGYGPHIAFIRRLTGLGWPALPDGVIYFAAAATIVSLLMALMFRLADPVLRRISRADDLITWTLTMLPLLTGMAILGESSAAILARDHPVYRTPLALHLLSLELLLVWFPFGKLMHAFLVLPARLQLATYFGRRGVTS